MPCPKCSHCNPKPKTKKLKRSRRFSKKQKQLLDAVYLDFLIWECHSFQWIMNDLHRLFKIKPEDYRVPATDIACALAFAANIAKMLWGRSTRGPEARNATKARARRLRKRVGVFKDKVLNDTELRNDLEHLDERLDDWAQKDKRLKISLFIQGPKGKLPDFRDDEMFLQCDPTTGEVFMLGHTVNLFVLEEKVAALGLASEKARNAIPIKRPVVM